LRRAVFGLQFILAQSQPAANCRLPQTLGRTKTILLMLTLYKTLLAPALLLQGRHLRETALRLPEAAGERSGFIPGTVDEPLGLLFVGDSSAAGVGVEWQHEALAQQAAEIVAKESKRSVRWHLIAKSGANTRDAIELVKVHANERADVVISALGVNDVTAQNGSKRFVGDYKNCCPSLHNVPARTQQ
jgi:GDSL-like Lipase/Acylhydrolase family